MTPNYTLHNEAGNRWILDPSNKVAAHLRSTVTAKQAEAVLQALADNHEDEPLRSKFLAAIQRGEVSR